jgi:leucyl-tRNA synthetase
MEEYNPQKIEKFWQKHWQRKKIFKTQETFKKPKLYVLDMFPYPSGAGLHVGHIRGYIATDVFSKMKMMQGFNILHPMGWDAFGLPAENYAITHKIHPETAVKKNIKNFKNQINKVGLGYDWSKEINTTDPNYYKWTQWIFLKMFENGLVYESYEPINWCPKCKTGLANEDLEGNRCERCNTVIQKKPLRQWVIKITQYAERLLEDLKLLDWEEFIIEQQKNWIGKSEGAIINFSLEKTDKIVEVFTTRLDTIFGCSYLVIAPEHSILKEIKPYILNFNEVENYIKLVERKTDLERVAERREKTGIKLKGILAINPFNNEKVPIFVADYVLPYYGTGAIMAVPAHDKRDFEFAKKFNLPIKKVIVPKDKKEYECFEEDGVLINSQNFSGLSSERARKEMLNWLKENKKGKEATFYKMRDWVFARQRYWGEPIPLVFCENCADKIKSQKSKVKN